MALPSWEKTLCQLLAQGTSAAAFSAVAKGDTLYGNPYKTLPVYSAMLIESRVFRSHERILKILRQFFIVGIRPVLNVISVEEGSVIGDNLGGQVTLWVFQLLERRNIREYPDCKQSEQHQDNRAENYEPQPLKKPFPIFDFHFSNNCKNKNTNKNLE